MTRYPPYRTNKNQLFHCLKNQTQQTVKYILICRDGTALSRGIRKTCLKKMYRTKVKNCM